MMAKTITANRLQVTLGAGLLAVLLSLTHGLHAQNPARFRLVKDINPNATVGSNPRFFTELLGKTYFAANDGTHGDEPWVSDGTAKGTFMLKDIYPGSVAGCLGNPVPIKGAGKLLFSARTVSQPRCLWVTDGTKAGTRELTKSVYRVYTRVELDGRLLFDNSLTGEIWVTDGTPAGTGRLMDLSPWRGFADPVRIGGRVWFVSYRQGSRGLFVTDGTKAGTGPAPLSGVTGVELLRRCGNRLWFTDITTPTSSRPWGFDPATRRATLLANIQVRTGGYSPGYVFSTRSKVYFLARDNTIGADYQLWMSDGTPAGTRKVSTQVFRDLHLCWEYHDQWPISYGLAFGESDRAFFCGFTATDGYEPWVTDGTASGTFILHRTYPGINHGEIMVARQLGSRRICFGTYGNAYYNNAYVGGELWTTDGTTRGTFPVTDILAPGGSGSNYVSYGLGICNGRVFFGGQKEGPATKGYELYAWDPGATTMPVGIANGAGARFRATDPVLGATTRWSITGAPGGTSGLILVGFPTLNPLLLAGSGYYLDPARPAGALALPLNGGAGSMNLPIANDPSLLGVQLLAQGFVGPTPTGPLPVDMLEGSLLLFGR